MAFRIHSNFIIAACLYYGCSLMKKFKEFLCKAAGIWRRSARIEPQSRPMAEAIESRILRHGPNRDHVAHERKDMRKAIELRLLREAQKYTKPLDDGDHLA